MYSEDMGTVNFCFCFSEYVHVCLLKLASQISRNLIGFFGFVLFCFFVFCCK